MTEQPERVTSLNGKFLFANAKCGFCGNPFRYRIEDNFNGITHSDKFCTAFCAEGRFADESDRLPLDATSCPQPNENAWDRVFKKRISFNKPVCNGCGVQFLVRIQDTFNGLNYSAKHCSPRCFKVNGNTYKIKQKAKNKPFVTPLKKNGKRYKYQAPVTLARPAEQRRVAVDYKAPESKYELVDLRDGLQAQIVKEVEVKCPTPTKNNFITKDAAWQFIGHNHKGDYLIRPYVCKCGKIHIGH
jgi:transcription elongation factor Elf1